MLVATDLDGHAIEVHTYGDDADYDNGTASLAVAGCNGSASVHLNPGQITQLIRDLTYQLDAINHR
jgi:hypothetical protein